MSSHGTTGSEVLQGTGQPTEQNGPAHHVSLVGCGGYTSETLGQLSGWEV